MSVCELTHLSPLASSFSFSLFRVCKCALDVHLILPVRNVWNIMNLFTHYRVVTVVTLIHLTLLLSNCSCQSRDSASTKNHNHHSNKHRDNSEPLSLAKSSSRVKSEFVAVESSNVHIYPAPSNLDDTQLDAAESHHSHSKHSKHHKHHENGKHEGKCRLLLMLCALL